MKPGRRSGSSASLASISRKTRQRSSCSAGVLAQLVLDRPPDGVGYGTSFLGGQLGRQLADAIVPNVEAHHPPAYSTSPVRIYACSSAFASGSRVEQHPLRLLDALLDPHQEAHRLAAVDRSGGRRRAPGTSSAGPRPGRPTHHRALLDRVHAEDADSAAGSGSACDSSEPKTPPLVIVKVPPWRSSMPSLPSRARLPRSPMRLLDLGEAHSWSASRTTGTTRPCSVLTATPMS